MTKRILCFGDSNTIADAMKPEDKWPAVFQSLVKDTETINAGVDGRAIGQQSGAGNGLESIDDTLTKAGKLDQVIIMLGTNDCQGRLWKDGGGAKGVMQRLQKLVTRIELYQPDGAAAPGITICLPPPAGSKILDRWDNPDMYQGLNDRVQELIPYYRQAALADEARYVDLFHPLKPIIDTICTPDGVHFLAPGYRKIGELIADVFQPHDKPAPPTGVKVGDGKLTWTPSTSKDILGYEIRDPEEDSTLTFSTAATANLPEGHITAWVYARDVFGNKSEAAKPPEAVQQ
jgi:lysophospholipase L1-like esterase